MNNIPHERVLALIELAIKELGNGDEITAVKVQGGFCITPRNGALVFNNVEKLNRIIVGFSP